jgi:Family of unknown function (DUF5335)
MSLTTKIPREQLEEYLDAFAKRFLRDGSPEAVDVEVLEPGLADQYVAQGARLTGLTYDRGENLMEIELDSGDHRIYAPSEVWALEDSDGFVRAVELVDGDGLREVVSIKRVGLRHID